MSKDSEQGFEAAVDFIADRASRMGLCRQDERKLNGLLEALSVEMRLRKVRRLEEYDFPPHVARLWARRKRRATSP